MAAILADLMLRLRSNSAELQKGVEQSKKSINSLDKTTKNASKSSNKNFKDMSKNATGAFSKISGSMGQIPGAAQGALGGFAAMAQGAKALFVSLGPIGAIILAVGIALKALSSFFKGSVDGAGKLASIMGFLKGILQVIQDAFIRLGRFMVEAFESPQESIKKLWEAIQQNLINRWQGMISFFQSSFEALGNGFKALGQLIKSVFNKDAKAEADKYFKAMQESMIEVGKSAVAMTTGLSVDKIVEKGTAALKEFGRVGEILQALEKRTFQLRLDSINLTKKEADARKKVSELIFISSDKEGSTLQERIDATREAGVIETQIAAQKIKVAEEALAIQRETIASGESGVADLEKEAQLYATLTGLYKERNDKVREIFNREEEILGVVRAVGEENVNLTQAAAAEVKKAQNEQITNDKKVQEAKVALVETAEKSLADYKRSLNEETELGALANLKEKLTAGLILEEEYAMRAAEIKKSFAQEAADAQIAIDEELTAKSQEEADKRMEIAQFAADSIGQGLSALSDMFEASKNRELKAAGDNAKKREEIEKKYAKKQKAIAIVQAVIGGALGIVKSFSQLGPIAGIVGAALVAATTAAQIAVIASQTFGKGGIVAGSSSFGDSTIIRANAGEMVLTKGQQGSLFKMLNSGGGSQAVEFRIAGDDLVALSNRYYSKLETY